MQSIHFSNGSASLAGHLYLPDGFSESGAYPAIACVHPGGGVKEQTSGLYAQRLAAEGFVTLAFDASCQGASGGELRQAEDPYARVEDVRAAIDRLSTMAGIDPQRIGVLGICAGGGYAINAAMTDRRIKAVGGVSTVNIGDMFRSGFDDSADPAQSTALAEMGSQQRNAELTGAQVAYLPWSPEALGPSLSQDMRDAHLYYRTARAQHERAPGRFPVRDLMKLIGYDAFHLADVLLTQPLQLVAGAKASSLWFSEDILQRAASQDKSLLLIPDANHIDLYDGVIAVPAAVARLTAFYRKHLTGAIREVQEASLAVL